jgi:FixJ family two-component response regulator
MEPTTDNPNDRPLDAVPDAHDARQATVLIASSAGIDRESIERALQQAGVTCVRVTDAGDLRGAVAKRRFDAVVLDLQLPGEHWLDVARHLQCCQPETPVVAVTATRCFDMVVDAVRSGIIDVFDVPVDSGSLASRVAQAIDDARHHLRREERVQRLRRICRQLNLARHEIAQQVDLLCDDLVLAYQELVDHMGDVAAASEFRALLSQELDVESLLRTTLEYLLTRTGPTNAAVFLPNSQQEFALGAYVNCDCPRETANVLLEHLGEHVCPQMVDETDIIEFSDATEFAEWVGADAAFLSECQIISFSCYDEQDCMAVIVLFRHRRDPFAEDLAATLDMLRPIFAEQIATVIRVHHRARTSVASGGRTADNAPFRILRRGDPTMRAAVTPLAVSLVVCSTAIGGETTITPLVVEGDAVDGVGEVSSIFNIAVNNDGTWLVEADTNNPDTDADSVLFRAGEIYLREGDPLPLPTGATLDSFDSIVINNGGESAWNFFLDNTAGGSDDSGIYFGLDLVLQESELIDVDGLSPETPVIGFFDVKINDGNSFVSVLSIDDPAISTSVDRAIIVFTPSGGDFDRTLVAAEGDVLPDQVEPVADFGTGPHQSAFNNGGDVMFFVDLAGDSSVDGAIYVSSPPYDAYDRLAQEGDPSPVDGRSWLSLSSPELDINNAGDVVFSGRLDGDTSSDALIVVNGEKFMQEGDVFSDGEVDYPLNGFGTGPLEVSDGGDVLWFADVDEGSGRGDCLVLGSTVLLEEGHTVIDGFGVVELIRGVEDGYHLSDDGRFVIVELGFAENLEGAFLIELPDAGNPFDLNGDGIVDGADLGLLLGEWGPCTAACDADFNMDGQVDGADLGLLLAAWD